MKFLIAFFICISVFAQSLKVLDQTHPTASYRGLSVVNPQVFWVAGSNGIIGKTTDGGKNFDWMIQQNYLKNEFRDLQAFDDKRCIVMAITEPAVILETSNGKRFKKRYEEKSKQGFFDSFDCVNFDNCLLIGDAIHPNELYLLSKRNGKWKPQKNNFNTGNGEVFFAASGSNIQMFDALNFIAVSGGTVSRLIYNYQDSSYHQPLEIRQGNDSSGANGFYFNPDTQKGIVVGGNFKNKEESMFNLLLFHWDKKLNAFSFELPESSPIGYKSSVSQLNDSLWVAVGTSGIDYSKDHGKNWAHFRDDPYHVIQKRDEKSAILVGPQGRIALIEF